MNERVVVFGDAIIAIVLTIMAFLQNIVDCGEDSFVDTLDNEQ